MAATSTTQREAERKTARPAAHAATGRRDRFVAAVESAPRISREDAELLKRVVREAREESIADGLSD